MSAPCRGVLGCAALAVACGGSPVRGGSLLAPERDVGKLVASYAPVHCQDAAGARLAPPPVKLALIAAIGPAVAIERRPGYPALVIENSFREGRELVFQVELTGEAALVREYRIDPSGASARLTVMTAWSEQELPQGRFKAVPASLALACVLEQRPAAPAARQGPDPLARLPRPDERSQN